MHRTEPMLVQHVEFVQIVNFTLSGKKLAELATFYLCLAEPPGQVSQSH